MTADLSLTLLFQSTFLLALGLIAAQSLRSAGAALPSAILRATLLALLLAPLTLLLPPTSLLSDLRARVLPPRADGAQHSHVQPAVSEAVPPQIVISPATIAASPAVSSSSPLATPTFEYSFDPRSFILSLPNSLFALWLLGAVITLWRLVRACIHLTALRRQAMPASAETLRSAARAADRLHVVPPPILMSSTITSPCLIGFFSPAILLPQATVDTPEEILLHELAHLRHRDCRWFFLARIATIFFWWQPLCHALARRLESSADQLCDDVVLSLGSDRTRYADGLLSIAERRSRSLPLAAGAVSHSSNLSLRIHRILDARRPLVTHASATAYAVVLAAAAGVLFLCALPTLAAGAASSPATAAAAKPLVFHGVLLDYTTKKPIPFAHVTIFRVHHPPGGGTNALEKFAPPDYITADASGHYTVNVPPEQAADPTMQLATKASAPHYGTTPWDGWGVSLIAHKNRHGDPTFGLRVLLYPADEITGVLKDWQGHPLSHVPVSLYSHSSAAALAGSGYDMAEQETETDAAGRYRVWALRDGEETTLTAYPKEWATIQLNIGKNRGDLGTTIADRGVTLAGTLFDSAGKGVANADVYASFAARFAPGDDYARRTTTDKDGHFALGPLPIEPYKVEVATSRPDDGGGFTAIPLRDLYTSLLVTDPTKPLDIRPVPAVHLRMRDVDPDGKPAPSIGAVWAMGQLGGSWIPLTIETDKDGELVFLAPKGMENTHMELGFSGYGNTLIRYRIGSDGPIQNTRSLNLGTLTHDRDDITLIQTRSPRLFVNVRAPDGSIPPHISAEARYKDTAISKEDIGGYDMWDYDQTPGRWTFERFIPGQEVSLTISAPFFHPFTQTLTMKDGERREITVTLQPAAK